MLAIGAVIGAGIFGAIGTAAAGQVGPDGTVIRYGAGPALVFSFLLLGGACALAALCYAELAAMIPQAGSAYAYVYATLGELVAWIIGWDLILEYAVGNVAVAMFGIVMVITWLLLRGARESSTVNTAMVIIKLSRGHRVLRLHRLRCDFDGGGGDAQSAAYQDLAVAGRASRR
jgi:amino acid transporter